MGHEIAKIEPGFGASAKKPDLSKPTQSKMEVNYESEGPGVEREKK